jgi:UDP-N-acetyl-D-glucosamine/UDP-N-acetyl-D-galactosamine dehydrogenase
MINLNKLKIAIIGMGYVGLPLSIAFSKKFSTIGYDINIERIEKLRKNIDKNKENYNFKNKNLLFTNNKKNLKESNFFIITVPTPLKKNRQPDLRSIIKATEVVSTFIKREQIVVYESTVYPGATEEICIPLIEKISGMRVNKDFFVGYSPERINPGDKKHTLKNTVKITSGSNLKSSIFINSVYGKIINKTHNVKKIKIAESAKIIENTQRDINIALINEFSVLLKKMKISTSEVLNAARTKWNFLDFRPGLVGGHCIGIDPYYLSYKFKQLNLDSKLILAGRNVNDNFHKLVANDVYNLVKIKFKPSNQIKTLVLGFTFKENCTDIRNSKIFDLVKFIKLKKNYKFKFDLYDPNYKKIVLNKTKYYNQLTSIYGKKNVYDLIIIAVPHKKIYKLGLQNIKMLGKKNVLIYDFKSLFGNKIDTNIF